LNAGGGATCGRCGSILERAVVEFGMNAQRAQFRNWYGRAGANVGGRSPSGLRVNKPRPYGRFLFLVLITFLILPLAAVGLVSRAQQEFDFELTSTSRLLGDVGPGLQALRRDTLGRFYALSAPGAAVQVYSPGGRLVGKIPDAPTKETALAYGADLDVDARSEQIYVADRDANLIRVYSSIETGGKDVAEVHVNAPISVAALPGDEIAVTSLHERRLVQIYDLHGNLVREFGGLADLADHLALNRYLNGGRLLMDHDKNLYLAFLHYPEPTVRRYDLTGHANLEIALNTLEFAAIAEAKRHVISDQDEKGKPADLKPVVNAMGVDPESGDVWIAVGDELVHYDPTGNRKGATYRTFSADGARVEPVSILIEPSRLILAANPAGVYTFARPDKLTPADEKPIEKTDSKPAEKPASPSQQQ
jgi:hypothetical protein